MRRPSALLRAVNALMAAVFALCMAVQYNDPDALLWIAVYCLPALFCVLAAAGRLTRLALPAAAVYAAGALWWMPWNHLWDAVLVRPTWHMTSPDNEMGRESIGLLICAAWLTYLGVSEWHSRRVVHKEEETHA